MSTQPRFVVDLNVGRLAKWLRVLGYDTLFPREDGDNQLVRLALQEGRVLVSRDSQFSQRRAARLGLMRVVQVTHDDLWQQLAQLVAELGLDLDNGFSRCVRCNAPLAPVPKEAVAGQVPPYVFKTQSQFMRCALCQRVYWRGTHWANMVTELKRVLQEVK